MTITDRVFAEMKEALRAKEPVRLSALRMIRASAKNKEIELGHALTDEELMGVMATMVKKHREAIELYEKSGNAELVEKETQELKVVQSFLPKPLSPEELTFMIKEEIIAVGALGPQDMGKVMKGLKAKVTGRADGRGLADLVKKLLAGC